MYERTDGNPFLCVELFRACSSGAGAAPEGAVDRLGARDGRRCDRGSRRASGSGARGTLDWAAFLPEPFTFDDLQAVAGAELEGASEEVADAGFLLAGQMVVGAFRIRSSVTRCMDDFQRRSACAGMGLWRTR